MADEKKTVSQILAEAKASAGVVAEADEKVEPLVTLNGDGSMKEETPAVSAAPDKEVVTTKTGKEIAIEDLTEADILSDAIIARPMGFGEELKIEPIRKEYAYRWVNRLGAQGQRYTYAKSLGFVNAEPGDVSISNPDNIKDGCIMVGDLILMKMPKMQYLGYIKYNHLKAEALVSKANLEKIGEVEGRKALKEAHAPTGYNKVGIYHPPIGELNKRLD